MASYYGAMIELLAFSALTIAAYALSLWARRRWPGPLTTPVIFSTTLIVLALTAFGVDFQRYAPTRDLFGVLLGPATMALALPLYRNRRLILAHARPLLLGIVAGTLVTMLCALVLARVFALGAALAGALAIKSVTVAIAIGIAPVIGADPALVAAFVIATGICGTVLGPVVLDRLGVRSPLARGLALGTISHGQGTAQAALENETSGAVAGVAMGISAILTALLAPWLTSLYR
jgi:putative effector of murein hydrolase